MKMIPVVLCSLLIIVVGIGSIMLLGHVVVDDLGMAHYGEYYYDFNPYSLALLFTLVNVALLVVAYVFPNYRLVKRDESA